MINQDIPTMLTLCTPWPPLTKALQKKLCYLWRAAQAQIHRDYISTDRSSFQKIHEWRNINKRLSYNTVHAV